MAEETKKVEEAAPKTPDKWSGADAKVKSVEAQLDAAKGKPGMNPYKWKQKYGWDKLVQLVKSRDDKAIVLLAAIPTTVVPKADELFEKPKV